MESCIFLGRVRRNDRLIGEMGWQREEGEYKDAEEGL